MLILYATETGTSQFLADMFYRQAIANQMSAQIMDIGDYNIKSLPQENSVVFFVSTAGDGEPPQSMINFWNFLLIKSLPTNALQEMKFTVFGCGDSSYEKFNYAARKLRSRLLQLSAKEQYPSAFGDEQHPCGVETEYILWCSNIFQQQRESIQLIECCPTQEETPPNFKEHKLISKIRLTPIDHDKNTTNFNFELNDLQYECGDIVKVYPKNSIQLVKQVMDILQLKDEIIEIKWKQDIKHFKQIIPSKISIFNLLRNYLNLTSPPTRYFIKILSQCVEDPQYKEKLEEMSSQTKEGLEIFYRYVERERRNVYEILYDFQPCKITITQLIDSLNLIRPREYSISSIMQEKVVGITVAIVEYKTSTNRQIYGFCSKFLEDMQENETARLQIKKGTFKLQNGNPQIMIGTGTGVASFISYIKYLKAIKSQQKNILIFGACYEDKEFYYKDLLKDNECVKLITAFSRDQKNKIYVQNRIMENEECLKDFIMSNLEKIQIYTAGVKNKMPKQVEAAFVKILNSQELVSKLKRQRQILFETW